MMATIECTTYHDMINVSDGVRQCSICKMADGRDSVVPVVGMTYLDVKENKILQVTAINGDGMVLGYHYPRGGEKLWPGLAEAAILDVTYLRKWCWI